MIEPAHLWVPERRGSYGDEAVDMMRLAGRELDVEQQLAVDAFLSYGPGGRWAALEQAIVLSRQNGKTAAVMLAVTLFDWLCLPPDRIVWTAHLFETAQEAFTDVKQLIEGCPSWSRRVRKVIEENGSEGILLKSGARLDFRARSKGRGRGLGGKRVVMDEALFLSASAMGALMPTLSAREDPQITYGSSAGVGTSDHLRRLRDRGREGGDPSLVYVEWKADGEWDDPPCEAGRRCPHVAGTPGCYLDDEAGWQKANPALGKRITVSFVRSERRGLPWAEFGRERLGWFDLPTVVAAPISGESWDGLADAGSELVDPVTLAVEVAFDQGSAVIAAAGAREDGKWHLEVADYRVGPADWVPARVAEMCARWKPTAVVVDEKGPAGQLIPALTEALAGVGAREVLVHPGPRDLCAAYTRTVEACHPDKARLRHRGQPELTQAVRVVRTRTLGDQLTWDRRNDHADVAPIVAASLALWGHTRRADPVVPLVIWR